MYKNINFVHFPFFSRFFLVFPRYYENRLENQKMTSLKYHPDNIPFQKWCRAYISVQDLYANFCTQYKKKKKINIFVKPIHSSLHSESKIKIEKNINLFS